MGKRNFYTVVRVLKGYKRRFIANPEVLSKLNLKDEGK